MELSVQLQSMVVSFSYGILLSYLLRLFYSWLFLSKKVFRIIFTFLFCFTICIFYFYCLYLINGGVIHFYFLFLLGFGVWLGTRFAFPHK